MQGNHSLKQGTAAPTEYKCINCMVYKKHHPTTQIDAAHTSLDKKMPQSKSYTRKIQEKHRILNDNRTYTGQHGE